MNTASAGSSTGGDDGLAALRAHLHAFIARRVEGADVADDLTQEVLVRLVRNEDDRLENPAAWLYRVARNVIIDHYRTRRREVPLESVGPARLGLAEDPFNDDPTAVRRELAQCLRSLVDRLPEPYRQAVRAVDLDGHTQVALAQASGLRVSGMKSRVQRGRRLLHRLLTECCPVTTGRSGGIIDYEPAGCEPG